jgi:hypothetical protein
VNEEKLLDALRNAFNYSKKYDVFLSHSYLDSEVVYGLKLLLEDLGLSVYVDWYDDPQLNRTNVTPETAALLKLRMRNSQTLLYAISENALGSQWTPWEIGYFDGINGKVAIVPVSESWARVSYEGQEYLGLYPYITEGIAVARSNWMTQTGASLFLAETKGGERHYRNLADWFPGPRTRTP